ncbi:guanine nucleotide exchange factor VAV3-like isoform X4 [Gigantopelta aegis]|uniref:guanine nucleotide exchange factor VAV3-like isoform X4 n=1 Tax=Gigantopelta aegis TaxID=1735272 RepID=UPI001B8881E4|nr:guanine nucleotide exchange factor VAV3-like isoform X4 [Gigantopelta aegis]
MADEWRQCVDWLVRCQILPDDHKATKLDANAFDLAQALRDGSLICHLLNQLSPQCVDMKDFSPRPQMSQFLCMKNIRTFLNTCKKTFNLKDSDLFQPHDLFDVKDFRKVLETLSKLSKTEKAQRKFSGFPPEGDDYAEQEDIYGNLKDLALETDLEDQEEIYDVVYQDDEIYDDLCYKEQSNMSTDFMPCPQTKRDYCLKEMIDTEKNYVDALKMIVQFFIKPLKTILSANEREVIFAHIETLLEVHKQFYADLLRTVTTSQATMSKVFTSYKSKLLVYGDYCSNLPHAQEMIDKVTDNETTRTKIQECERQANEGKFRLRDLLHVPMQRVLKYHLLLRELIKNTDRNDRGDLEIALEAMQDLSLYVNEVKRDHESLQLIEEIQNSIVDLNMHLAKLAARRPNEPAKTTLKDYGRFQKDGELKVLSHLDSRVRNRAAEKRHIFLFDKVMLMCKARMVEKLLWGDTYSFKNAIVLGDYKVDDTANTIEKRWNCPFIMVQKNQQMAYTFYAKTEEVRVKWVEAINMALDNTQPQAGPNYLMQTFDKPTECDVCGKLLRGIFFQGYMCQDSKKAVHKECIGKPKQARIHHRGTIHKAKANMSYQGTPTPNGHKPLKFKSGDVIEVLDQSGEWWKGRFRGEEGYFPANYVTLTRLLFVRPAYEDPIVSPGPLAELNGPSSSSIADHQNISMFSWYVGEMERDAAQSSLDPCPDGTFLIRVSTNQARKGAYSLSIKYANAVRHIKVNKTQPEGKFYLAEGRYFDSVPRLVDHYQHHSLQDSFPDVVTTLRIPIKQASGQRVIGYAVAVYDYAATSTSQLSLKIDDRIAVISKNGSDKGWWKGENLRTNKIGYFPLAYVEDEDY